MEIEHDSALGIRDPTLNDNIGKAPMAGPARWTAVTAILTKPMPLAGCTGPPAAYPAPDVPA
jgi:hypothetical protein